MKKIALFAILLGAAGSFWIERSISQNAVQKKVGPLPDGGFLLNSGWAIHPAGSQVTVSTFPMRSAVSSDGKFLLTLNAGYDPPTISVIDITEKKERSRTRVEDAWLGLLVKGNLVYVGGGSTGKVFEFSLAPDSGALALKREFSALSNLAEKGNALIGDIAISLDGKYLYATDLYDDAIQVVELDSAKYLGSWKTGRRPYRIMIGPNGKDLLVTAWGDAALLVHDSGNGAILSKIRVGAHPTDMLWINRPPAASTGGDDDDKKGARFKGRVFVTASNTNNAYVYGVTGDGQLTPLETLNISTSPLHPLGMTPSALAADPDGSRLYVVCSDANSVAEVDISQARSRVMGFIPAGWYPTAISVLKDGALAILNGKGLGSRANPKGPDPSKRAAALHAEGGTPVEYVGHIQTGTAQFLPAPDDAKIAEYTATVLKDSPYKDSLINGPITDQQTARFAKTDNQASPIQHVIYVIKENRTYDQVLGDMPKGNGDVSLTLFGEKYTPNLHKLAADYILYDNFYENADVSAEGHNWASAAIAPDYTVKLWPSEYGHRSKVYDFEGEEPANTPPAGYLWTNALQAGVTIRNYGQWCTNIPLKNVNGPRQIAKVKDTSLVQHTDMNFRGFDLDYPDVDRAREFIREWKEFDAAGKVPQLSILRIGNDHTAGTRAGSLTPFSFAADNDYAVGMLVEAVSQSKAWAQTAIFIIEDDAQNGPDHVDSHRAPVWVISPYTRRGLVDSTMYNQTSVLRTMELILGLRPMTQFDAAAQPMFGGFSQTPDVRPYAVVAPKISLTERNPGDAIGAKESAKMDFRDADEMDDDELNDILWRALKGTSAPAPMRSAFSR